MSESPKKYVPTLKQQPGLKLTIKNTQEGREFLEKLKSLLGTKELPFIQTCPPTNKAQVTEGGDGGSTTYSLDLRLEQEGFPP